MQQQSIEWRVIPQYSNYEASSDGRIRRLVSNRLDFQNRILSQRLQEDRVPYYTVRVTNDHGVRKCLLVHTLINAAFNGPKPFAKAVTRHLDGNPKNNSSYNLCWGTPVENMQDAIKHRCHPCALKSKGDVGAGYELKEYWRALRKLGWKIKDIADMYGMHKATISWWTLGKNSRQRRVKRPLPIMV